MVKKEAKKPDPKPAKVSKKAAPDAESSSLNVSSVGSFIGGTREELTKVVWPSRQQLISESAAVILMVSLSATLIYFVDKLFGWASNQVF
ncbi:MAG: preprotein translocase subunit SecE [Cyanobacteria bacterium P01_A01_bin.105]